MDYLKQFFIIVAISFAGEALNHFIPLPIPASIYGLVIMLVLLTTKILPLKNVKKASDFLIKIMPVMLVAPASGLMICTEEISSFLVAFLVISVVSTVLVMVSTGKTAEFIIRRKKEKSENE